MGAYYTVFNTSDKNSEVLIELLKKNVKGLYGVSVRETQKSIDYNRNRNPVKNRVMKISFCGEFDSGGFYYSTGIICTKIANF